MFERSPGLPEPGPSFPVPHRSEPSWIITPDAPLLNELRRFNAGMEARLWTPVGWSR